MVKKRTFGNVYESRGRWRVRYSVGGKRFDITGGDTQEEAEAVLARITLERQKGRLDGRPTAMPKTLREFASSLWALWDRTLRPATLATRAAPIKRYSDWLTKPMRDVTTQDANAALLRRLAEGAALSSVETDRSTLHAAWNVARRMGIVVGNPWKRSDLALPRPTKGAHRRLDDGELAVVYEKAPDALRLPILLMGECGLRRNEATSLLWADVGPGLRTVTVRAEIAKSGVERTIPTAPRLVAALREAGPALPTALVCGIPNSTLNARFREYADELGMTDVTPHTLRHTYGHRIAEAGASVYVLRDLMGHSSVTTTEVYMGSASERAMRAAIEQAERHRATS